MILESVLGLISGVGGTAITSFLNLKQQKQKNEHDLKMAELDHRNMLEEAKINMQRTEQETIKAMEEADAEIFETSMKLGNEKVVSNEMVEKLFDHKYTKWLGTILVFILGLVEATRKSIRPGVTIVLLYVTSYMTMKSIGVVTEETEFLTQHQISEIIGAVIYLTFTVIGWWFGDRRVGKFAHRLNDGNFRR